MSDTGPAPEVGERRELVDYDRLIKWALSHAITRYGLTLDAATDFSDLVQTVYLRLVASLSRRELPEHMPSYIVCAARRVISDIVRDRSRQKNAYNEDADGLVGRLNRNTRSRIARGTRPEDREQARQRAATARWQGHESKNSEVARAAHRESEKRRRERRRIEAEGEVSIPKFLEKRQRVAISSEERKARQKEYRVAKQRTMSPEEQESAKQYNRQKQAEYRARRKASLS